MNVFFERQHVYEVNDSADHVRENLDSILKRKWYDFSINMTGKLHEDGSFKLTHKWSFDVIKWIENSPAYLSGKIISEGSITRIETKLRPNSAFVFFVYLLALLFLCELFGMKTLLEGPRIYKLYFLPIFILILLGMMQLFTTRLRNRFERVMQLQRNH